MEEKVSIIIPIYNAEKYIKRCIDTIINQTYKNIEIIIINDGSTDNSINLINKYNRLSIKGNINVIIDKGKIITLTKGITITLRNIEIIFT